MTGLSANMSQGSFTGEKNEWLSGPTVYDVFCRYLGSAFNSPPPHMRGITFSGYEILITCLYTSSNDEQIDESARVHDRSRRGYMTVVGLVVKASGSSHVFARNLFLGISILNRACRLPLYQQLDYQAKHLHSSDPREIHPIPDHQSQPLPKQIPECP